MASKIFIVEDNRFYSGLLKNEIEKSNLGEVEVFPSGEMFLNNMDRHPEIVILDHHLGTTNGLDLLKEVKGAHPQVEFILLSAQESMNIAVHALKYGAYDYVEKNKRAFSKVNFLIRKIQFEISERRNSKIQRQLQYAGIIAGVVMVLFWALT